MANLLSFLNNFSEIGNYIFYFSAEILLLIGVIFNFILLPFRKKINIIKTSNIITTLTFAFAILSLFLMYLISFLTTDGQSIHFSFDYSKALNWDIFLKTFINLFMMLFSLISFKYTKKYRYKVPTINSIGLLLAICGCFIVKSEYYFLTYLLIEIASLLVYKYGSNMRARKFSPFSVDYIILSSIATILFIVFYLASFKAVELSQTSIINICLSVAILMKIGIFPIYNFLITKPSKTNIPFSILLFCYLPWVGVMGFSSMSDNIIPGDEIYQISMIVFVMISLITFSFYASKHRNIIKFFGNFSYFINGLCVLGIIYFQANFRSISLATMFAFSLFSLYCLIGALKSSFKLDKIYVANLKGIFLNNKLFAFLFASILIMMTGLAPGGIAKEILRTVKNIYTYDKTGFVVVCIVALLLILILFNSIKIVQNIYTFDKKNIIPVITKRTTVNYVVPFVVMIFLLLKIFL